MSARELQQACRDRGLPTARDKDTMVARLTEADAEPSTGEPENACAHCGSTEHSWDDCEEYTALVADEQASVTPAVWQERYPARANGLDNTEHHNNCAAVVAAAQARGYQTAGGGYRAGTVNGEHVYEVHLRRGPS